MELTNEELDWARAKLHKLVLDVLRSEAKRLQLLARVMARRPV